ncbi:MAG TPA: hypothetical protein VN950_13240 [Terriglobales bacterium]|nr:hypothetical protein [Terriglobales bacterium]
MSAPPEHIKPLLISTKPSDDGVEWILLDGWQSNFSKARSRNSFSMIRTYVVPIGQEDQLTRLFQVQKPRGGWLDQREEERGVFGGEVPWGPDIPPDKLTEIEFITGTRTVWRNPTYFDSFRSGVQTRRPDGKIRDRITVIERRRALVPVRRNEFSTRSPLRRDNATIPSQALLLHADLAIRLPYWDFYDRAGKLASTYVEFGGSYDSQHFTYFRRDLLDRFLTDHAASVIWVIWGERQLLTPSGMNEDYRQYKELHTYKSKRREKRRCPTRDPTREKFTALL